ncbi:MAG: hypothetical protein UY21_C0001G0115 [Microgenomates group bacterium GW2011_GWA1_48_10]|nr:MAG: hypothetical protein UY21_C0001G0115 [Microgenomates group bacterium GW2011_GWA1_48_10]
MSKVIQSGHSLAVTIPREFVQMVGIKKGDNVKIEKRPNRGALILRFKGAQQLVIAQNVLRSPRKKNRPQT